MGDRPKRLATVTTEIQQPGLVLVLTDANLLNINNLDLADLVWHSDQLARFVLRSGDARVVTGDPRLSNFLTRRESNKRFDTTVISASERARLDQGHVSVTN